ncbi:hypothetical protein [Clostridium sporogenes]|nr:hypothetical protein [Clostridium sporogenes]KRU46288.1 hypothetical protein VT94_04620 [Clostridium sporogenes]MBY7064364.1 hypothetical protein [Clostridium sporogenes]MBY7071378.1 hypothetical protein [Clostridium sporogenes]MCW6064795.1 hypothetical protein [Clostridium sporogenes]OQP89690.1 hypothetical protein VT93_0200970 [Clostridium sporogenes]
MKVKAKIECTGEGYKDFHIGEIRNLPKQLAEKLIAFSYAEEVKKGDK